MFYVSKALPSNQIIHTCTNVHNMLTYIETHHHYTHFTFVWYRLLCMPPAPFLPNSNKWTTSSSHGPTTGSWDKATKMGCQHTFTTHAQNHFTATQSAGRAHTMTAFTTTTRDCYRLQVLKWFPGTKARLTCKETTLLNVLPGKFSLLIVQG